MPCCHSYLRTSPFSNSRVCVMSHSFARRRCASTQDSTTRPCSAEKPTRNPRQTSLAAVSLTRLLPPSHTRCADDGAQVCYYVSAGMGAKYCDDRVSVSVCPLADLNNNTSKVHEILSMYSLWPWLGRSLTTEQLRYVFPVLWMTSCLPIMPRG